MLPCVIVINGFIKYISSYFFPNIYTFYNVKPEKQQLVFIDLHKCVTVWNIKKGVTTSMVNLQYIFTIKFNSNHSTQYEPSAYQ